MAELQKKKRFRAGHRASATRLISQTGDSLIADPVSVTKLKQLEVSLREKMTILKTLDSEILDALEEEGDFETEIEQADVCAEKIQLAIFDIEAKLKLSLKVSSPPASSPTLTHTTIELPDNPTDAHEASPDAETTSTISDDIVVAGHSPHESTMSRPSHGTKVKLPKIVLKTFDGNPLKWTPFWDSFKSTIHDNEDLSEVDKFNYLHSQLERSAAEAISGLSLTARNYPEAVSILKKRFGDRQRIISKHMEALLHLDTVQNHSARSLRRMYDEVESHVRSLNSLGVLPESYGSVVASTLLNKLPHDVRLIVSRGVSDTEWNLECFLKTLNDEIEARERAVSTQICPQQSITINASRKPYRDLPAARTLFSSTDSCVYCGSAHSSNCCNTVADVDSRKQTLKKAGKCFNCLKRHHTCRECRSSMRCSNCKGKHHPSICHKSSLSDSSTTKKEIPSTTPSSTSTSMYTDVNTPVLLQTARAVVFNPDNTDQCMTVRILFDGGSQRSYITDQAKRNLGLSAEAVESILIKTFGSKTDHTQLCDIVKLLMKMRNGDILKLSLLSVPFICDPVAVETLQYVVCNHPHLKDLELADRSENEPPIGIDILIGADNYWNLVTGMIIRNEDAPTAMETRLGWVLSGPIEGQTDLDSSSATGISSTVTTVNYVSSQVLPTETDAHLNSTLKKFWDLDTLGIREVEDSLFERFSRDIVFKEGRYEVKLPWRDNHPILPSNYQMSLKRLFGLLRRLKSDPSLFKEYNDVITDQLNRGIVERVKEPNLSHNEAHYIPHHAVVRRDKETTKLRIVFDGSAKENENGPSLNECLHAGPSLYQGILEILLRFRMFRVGLIGDIEKAFLMVSVTPKDRDVLRFLWVDDIQKDVPQVVTLRFKRVIFGVSCSPFLLNATIYHHLLQYQSGDSQFVHKFLRSIYVDDLVSGASTTDEAFCLYTKSKACLKEGGFNLRRFVSNSAELQEKIELVEGVSVKSCNGLSVDCESYSRATLGANQGKATEAEQKVLGVVWNVQRDCFVFDLCHIVEAAAIADETKRGIASVATRFYDPIGVLSPCIVMFKLLLQKIWESSLDWDQPLTGELLSCWRRIVIEIKNAKPISIPRCSLPSTMHASFSLQGFCDASSKAYAAVIYLRAEFCDTVNVQFLVSKNRVAPKGHTIPRLELLSALLLSRLVVTVTKALGCELNLEPPLCYTDSQVALYWICSGKEWKQFVQNRVDEIRRLVPMEGWRHCKGSCNPADLPSRGVFPCALADNPLWLNGPEWLTSPLDSDEARALTPTCEVLKELKRNATLVAHIQIVCTPILNCEAYSSLNRLLRVTAKVIKFAELLRRKTNSCELTKADLQKARSYWLRISQQSLQSHKSFQTWSVQFGLFLDDKDGLWRCNGRLGNANIPETTKQPILLLAEHHLTLLIVRECHNAVKHNGVSETLAHLRSEYWIVRGRNFVRKFIHQCVICRKLECQPYKSPSAPALPDCRVSEEPPFTFTGIDFAGPLHLKDFDSKHWICLFTCAVVRAVHLEVVSELSARSFIRCFSRFVSRRGLPKLLISDNAKTFKSAKRIILETLNDPTVKEYLANRHVGWTFNLELAPWSGGFFERLIGLTKRCLKKTIGKSKMSYDELITTVVEIEAVLNSRPLTYVSCEEISEPLTPSHLMIGRRLLVIPRLGPPSPENDPDFTEVNTPKTLHKRLIYLNTIIDQFWTRWRQEYLIALRDRHRHSTTVNSESAHIQKGDVCVLHDPHCPRTFWRLAIIQDLIPSRDGQVRGAVVKTVTQKGAISILRRPIKYLYPLEISKTADSHGKNELSLPEDSSDSVQRPTRAAAQRARTTIRQFQDSMLI